jgi:glycosyltransferase involved in cell wall biosynthesis
MKLACVVHRFGPEIAGGSESHCRVIAEHLAAAHDVTILTTCARDHITWRNEYPAGVSQFGALHVRRFPVARERSLHRFHDISEVVFSGGASTTDQEQWFRENGPESPELLEFLEKHGREFDRILFWSFRYYQSFFGLPLVADRAVLVPTAEEDPVIRLGILDEYFAKPAAYLFLTPEEETLVSLQCTTPLPASAVIGVGLDPVHAAPPEIANSPTHQIPKLDALGVSPPYLLYLGRIDPNKGCATLLRFFARRRLDGVPLVLAGPANMPVPDDPLVKKLGFVDAAAREALIAHALALVVPSPYESLSMVLLEAWNHGIPALVNGRCRVLKGQALRANGALYYHNYDEFARGLELLIGQPELAGDLGAQGLRYVEREYRWPKVMAKIEQVLRTCN